MAKQRVNVAILDRVDGMPAMILANGNWGQWSNELKKYVDTGVRSYPEDDANNIKYFKLTNTSETPQAPTQTGGWGSLEELNKALKEAGWSEDPKSVSETARFQWMAVYQKENIPQPDADTGVMKFVPRYTYSVTGLFNNFAPSPTVSFDPEKQVITITNPNGSSVAVKIPTPEAVKALSDMVAGLKKQVDKAVYSYEGNGAPTMDGTIVKDWLEGDNGKPITDDKTKADIFATHVGDAYFDKEGNTAYRFTLRTGGDPSNPADYGWEVVKDNALSSAIAKIAEMEGETVKIWTETPANGDSYKVGDILIYKQGTEWRYKHCIKANTPPQYLYSDTDWVEPYATVAEVKELREKLTVLSGDLQTATSNIADLKKETEDIKGRWIESIKDGIISEQERANLNDTSKRIDEEQAQLKSNVDYILGSPYFSDKEGFKATADAVIASGVGSIDKLQKAIADAIADSKITKAEREAVTQAFALYDSTRETLLKAIKDAKSEIDKQIPASVQVGGRNLLIGTDFRRIDRLDTQWWRDAIPINRDDTYPYVIYGYGWRFAHKSIHLEPGTYTLSVTAKSHEQGKPGELRIDTGLWKYGRSFGYTTDEWKRYSIQFAIESPYDDLLILLESGYYKTSIRFADIKLEKGTVATDWTPAPEDVQAEIEAVERGYQKLIEKVDVEFAISNSRETAPTSGWVTNAPTPTRGQALWQRTKVYLKDGTTEVRGVTCIQGKDGLDGKDGANGSDGADGRGIAKIVELYYLSSSNTALANGAWTETTPTPKEGYWIWTKTIIHYTTGGQIETKPICVTGDKGDKGNKGDNGTDALTVSLNRQGSFRTTYRVIGDNGEVLDQPRAVQTVEGGVNGKVVVTATIRKGVTDVTEVARTNGGDFRWLLNGTQIASGTSKLELGVGEHVDGVADDIEFSYDDTNAKDW